MFDSAASTSTPSEQHIQDPSERRPPRQQMLKWIGNKQRFAALIASHLPSEYDRYIEPFVGTGAVLAAMQPTKALAGDTLESLIAIWHQLQEDPEVLASHYERCWAKLTTRGKDAHAEILDRYNADPNPGDLLVLSRSCYGGVVRFTKSGRMSTPMGPHRPLHPDRLRECLSVWQGRVAATEFRCQDFETTLSEASENDIVYCDPPYSYSQAILYGAQDFRLEKLWASLELAHRRGARIALSLDGHRRNGTQPIETVIPEGLFQRELLVERGGCMLRRFQLEGENVDDEQVADRLLFSW